MKGTSLACGSGNEMSKNLSCLFGFRRKAEQVEEWLKASVCESLKLPFLVALVVGTAFYMLLVLICYSLMLSCGVGLKKDGMHPVLEFSGWTRAEFDS
jgi:hypothetical protein